MREFMDRYMPPLVKGAFAGPLLLLVYLALLSLAPLGASSAQELVPRRWSHLPEGVNVAGGGYAHTQGDISFDPVLKVEDAKMSLNSWVAKYVRSFELAGKSARVDVTQAYHDGQWSGLLDGERTTVKRSGWSDTVVRFAVNLLGAPPLAGKDYLAYRANNPINTTVGAAILVQLPTGQYLEDKLINLGTNRFTFRGQLGVVHTRYKWSYEITGSAWLYTDNNKFFDGNKLETAPFYTVQGHITYTFRPGLWTGASIGYGNGAAATINGVDKNDRRRNLLWAASIGYPLNKRLALKLTYVGLRTRTSVGSDTDTVSLSFSTNW